MKDCEHNCGPSFAELEPEEVWEVELLFFESADYLVCFTEDGKMWAPIPHAKGGLYLSTKSVLQRSSSVHQRFVGSFFSLSKVTGFEACFQHPCEA